MIITFYIIAALAILFAIGLVAIKNPVRSALSLVGCLIMIGVLFIVLRTEFIGAVQILIYAGAIMVLFLFIIMLLNVRSARPEGWVLRKTMVIGVLLVFAILFELIAVIQSFEVLNSTSDNLTKLMADGEIKMFGKLLVYDYLLHFEVIAILLIISVMGANLLAKPSKSETEEEPS